MKIINLNNLLNFLNQKTKKNYSWNDFCGYFYVFETIDKRLTAFDNGDSYDLERFSDIIENKFNTELCSIPLKHIDKFNGGIYFELKELVKWDFLNQFKLELEKYQEEKLLSFSLDIDENQIQDLMNCLEIFKDDKLKNNLKRLNNKFKDYL